ncbi:hypothetical protein H0H92_000495 [Tricholoma furcatifolium]|nr:hypothetical protein H0H92_000495 [Tricholoma furcatifolium]
MHTKTITLVLFAFIAATQAAPLSDRTSPSALQIRGDAECSDDPSLPQCAMVTGDHDDGGSPKQQPPTSVPAPADAATPHHPPPPPPPPGVATSIFQDHSYIWLGHSLSKFFATLF